MKIKLIAALAILTIMAIGACFGLAKLGVIPARKWAGQKSALGLGARLAGFKPFPKKSAAPTPGVPSPLTPVSLQDQKNALDQERQQFNQERAAWEAAHKPPPPGSAAPPVVPAVAPNPQQLARLADIYSKMDASVVNKILSKLPEPEVIALLSQMESGKVASILAEMSPVRAAQLTQSLTNLPAAAQNSDGTGSLP